MDAAPLPGDSVRAEHFRRTRELLSQLSDASVQAVAAVLRAAESVAELRLLPWSDAAGPPASDSILSLLRQHFFSELEARIVSLLARAPLCQRSVAPALHEPAGGRVRECLAGLVSRGVLRTGPDGYEVARPEFVELARGRMSNG